ncbi:MAG: TonB-dependent receptor plug domain-containing protein [Bacteroidota bacterium]
MLIIERNTLGFVKIGNLGLLLILFLLPHYTFSNTVDCSLEIRVTDTIGQQIPGALVEVVEAALFEVTDEEGKVRFQLDCGQPLTIKTSFLGFETRLDTVELRRSARNAWTVEIVESPIELGMVTVEAKPDRGIVARGPHALEVLSLKEIRHQPKAITDIIDQMPGVRIRQEGGMGSMSNIMLNGIDGKGVRVFLDGFPTFLLGSTFDINNISLGMIERVEVYKGTIPVEFGTDALGGIINLVTRSNEADYLDASYAVGSWNTHNASLSTRKTWGKTGTFFTEMAGFYSYSDNNYWMDEVDVVIDENLNTTQGRARRFNDAFRSVLGRLKLGVQDLSWADELLLTTSYSEVFKEWQHGVRAENPWGQAYSEQEVWNALLSYRKKQRQGKWDLSLAAGYTRDHSFAVDTSSFTYFWDQTTRPKVNQGESDVLSNGSLPVIELHSLFGRGVFSYALHPAHRLNLTLLAHDRQLRARNEVLLEEPRNRLDEPQQMISTYAGIALESKLADSRLTNIASFKHYYMDVNGVEYQGQGFVGRQQTKVSSHWGYGNVLKYWVSPQLALSLGYEYTIRQPEGLEIFGDYIRVRSNPTIEAEKSHNINVGANYLFDKYQLRLDGAFFYRNTQDRIFLTTTTLGTARFNNLVSTEALGASLNLNCAPFKNIFLNLNATYQHITLLEIDPESVVAERYIGSRVPNIPHLFANGQLSYALREVLTTGDKLNLSTNLNYVEEFFLTWAEDGRKDTKAVIPRQVVQDLGLSWVAPDEKWSLGLECRNLWDVRAFDNYSVQKPGRSVYAQLRVFLQKEK